MKTIEYSDTGIAFADSSVQMLAREFLLDPSIDYINISTENFVLAIRALVYSDVYSYKDVVFTFFGHQLMIDKDARFAWMPPGFCDYADNFLTVLLTPKK